MLQQLSSWGLAIAITGGFIPLWGLMTASAIAQTHPSPPPSASASPSTVQWRPKENRGRVGSTLSGGRRDAGAPACPGVIPSPDQISTAQTPATQLSLLAPQDPAGLLTTQAQPTLAWSVQTQQPVSMVMMLSHPQQAQPIYSQALTANHSGVFHLTLPESITLEPNVRYRWTVVSACRPVTTTAELFGSGIYARSFITRLPASIAQFSPSASVLEQVSAQAAQGYWYDAVGLLVRAIEQNPDQVELRTTLTSLLQQAQVKTPSLQISQR